MRTAARDPETGWGLRKRVLFRTAAAALSIVLSLGAFELAARLWGPAYHRFANDTKIYFTNPRGYHDVVGKIGDLPVYGLNYRLTPEGYRLPDDGGTAPAPAAGAAKRLLFIGDSFTLGMGVRYEDTCVARLGRMFEAAGRPIAVTNHAVMGADIENVVDIYSRTVAQQSFDAVVYGFVLNDFGRPMLTGIYGNDFIDFNNGGNRYDPLRSYSAFYNFVRFRIDRLRLHRVTLRAYLDSFRGPHAAGKFEMLQRIVTDARARGMTMIIMVFPLFYDLQNYSFPEAHALIREYCRAQGLSCLDLLPLFEPLRAEDLWVNEMDHHPNERAHEMIAGELFKFLGGLGI
ncbi:MAG: SGNH/GDSL hydrolase family protein [Deltaproteobacteria bacterium]|nr:SGNH/GDSL hydrolase family protein [Deltaproteobacteria bacterium]